MYISVLIIEFLFINNVDEQHELKIELYGEFRGVSKSGDQVSTEVEDSLVDFGLS